MLNLKSRTHRSSSSILAALGKENMGNKLNLDYKLTKPAKIDIKKSYGDDKLIKRQELPQIKKTHSDNYETQQSMEYKSVRASLRQIQQPIIDVKKVQNEVLKNIYSHDIMDRLKLTDSLCKPSDVLRNHCISKDLRAKMVDWMIEVLSSYKYSQNSFFTAVRIMDTFFMNSTVSQQVNELHLTGVTSIFIACKYEEIYPLKLKVVYEKIAHKKLSKEQIIKKESDILGCLNFDLVGVNNYELAQQAVLMSNLENELEKSYYQYFEKVCLYLSKMCLYDVDLVNVYDYCALASAAIYVSFKILEQVEPKFQPDERIKSILCILGTKQVVMMQAAAKLLAMAKNWHKIYPTLNNLKKFNSFTLKAGDGFMSERIVSNQ